MPLSDDLLMAGLMDALDPGDALALDDIAAQDLQTGLRRGGLGFLADVDSGGAPGLGLAASAPVLGDGMGYREGERVAVPLPSELPPESMKIAVFHQFEEQTSRVFPTPGGEWPSLGSFRSLGDSAILDLVVPGPPGKHIYVIAMLPGDLFETPWPEGDGAWERLCLGVIAGRVGGEVLSLEVRSF